MLFFVAREVGHTADKNSVAGHSAQTLSLAMAMKSLGKENLNVMFGICHRPAMTPVTPRCRAGLEPWW